MKLLQLLTLFSISIGSCAPLTAEEPLHPAKPMLWKVEGKGLSKPSWLFGTIHLGGAAANLHPAAAKAFESSDIVYTEIPSDEDDEDSGVEFLIREDGKTLTESIGPDLTKQLNEELAFIRPGLTAEHLKSFKTWATVMTIDVLFDELAPGKPLDEVLWSKAVASGKSTAALETAEYQQSLFDSLSEQEQIIFLSEFLKSEKEERAAGEDSDKELFDQYLAGDIDLLEKGLNQDYEDIKESDHPEFGEKMMKLLAFDRNANMAAAMIAELTAKPHKSHFFAVGGSHYLGKSNIRDLLTAEGYQVILITE